MTYNIYKRLAAAAGIALIGFSAFALGGKESSSSGGTVEVTAAFWDIEKAVNEADKMQDPTKKVFEEKLGIKIVPQNITWEDDAAKIKLWAASDSLPDIFSGDFVGKPVFYDWIEQGIIRALPDDLSAYPHLKKYLKDVNADAVRQNGKLYIIPRKIQIDTVHGVLHTNICYRWDLAQKAGVTKEPETWDEFRDMIKKIIAADPEHKKISGLTTQLTRVLSRHLMTYGCPAENKWVKKDGKWMPGYFAGNMKAAFQLARDMYQEGTIEKDIALAKQNIATEKFLKGESAAMSFALGGPVGLYTNVGKDYDKLYPGRKFTDDVKMLKLMKAADGKRYFYLSNDAWSETYFSSHVDDVKMARILKMYDYMLSPEGQTYIYWGFEGTDYTVKNGKRVPVYNAEGEPVRERPFAGLMGNFLQWSDAAEGKPAMTVPPGYIQMSDMSYQDAKKNGTIPAFDDRVLYLSTPLKNAFLFDSNEDLLSVMIGKEPVDAMIKDLMKKYETKGLSSMIHEVTQKASKMGIK